MAKKFKLILIIISAVLAVTIVTGGVIVISKAIKKNKQSKCEHEFGDVVIVTESTCETDGLSMQTCTLCEYEHTETIPAFGHTEYVILATPATCLESGLSDGISCRTCEKVIVPQVKIPALGHNVVTDQARPATCVTYGLTQGSHCKRCNFVTKPQERIPAKGHVIVESEGYPATCTTPGLTKGSYCQNCHTVYSPQEEIDATGHNFIDGTCANCGILEDEIIQVHSFRNGFCSDCGEYEYVYDNDVLYIEESVAMGDVVTGWYRMYRDDINDKYFSITCNMKDPYTGEIVSTNGVVNFYVCSKQKAALSEANYNAVAMFMGQTGPAPHEDIITVAYDDYVDIFLYGGCEISWYFEKDGEVIIDTMYVLDDNPTINSIEEGFVVKRLLKTLPDGVDPIDTTLATEVPVEIGEFVVGNWYRVYKEKEGTYPNCFKVSTGSDLGIGAREDHEGIISCPVVTQGDIKTYGFTTFYDHGDYVDIYITEGSYGLGIGPYNPEHCDPDGNGFYDFEITESTTITQVEGQSKVFRLVFEN